MIVTLRLWRTSYFLKSIFVIILLAGSHFSLAQVSGLVVDKVSGQPVPFVSVALYATGDSTAASGSITDTMGRYIIPNVKTGNYTLKTFYVGYKPFSLDVNVNRGRALDLGTLGIEAESKLLDEVRVTGQRAEVLIKADRQTYRAGQFQSAAGGTATDVLRNLPGLSVNAEGEVSLRGTSGFLVLLNGKPVQANLGTLLNQLPANTIESIEVITTPNARFDSDGKAGIISIITSQGADLGWSALVNGLAGLPSVNSFDNAISPRRYGLDGTLNFRSARWDLTLSSAFIRNDAAGRREGDVATTIGNRTTRFPSIGERSFDRQTFTNRLAVNFTPNASNSWNLGLYQSQRKEDRLADIFYTNTTTNNQTQQIIGRANYFNSNLVRKEGAFYTTTLDYAHTFKNKAQISSGVLFEQDNIGGFTKNRNLNQTDFRDTLQYSISTTDRPIANFRAMLDGSVPVWGGKLEAGYQYRFQEDSGDYLFLQQEGNRLPLVQIPEFTGGISITNFIHSWYTQFGAKVSNLEYTVGLRFEHSVRNLLTRPQNEAFSLTLNNLFPSFNVQYKPGAGVAIKAGYSRRVQRNSNFALNPLPEREHSETLEQGDPNLLPEFVDLAEIGLSKEAGTSTLLATFYYQGVSNVINRVNRVYADTILSRIFTNAGQARRVGLELAADLKITSRWKLFMGGTVYRYTQEGALFDNSVNFDRRAWVYSVNANSTVQLNPTLSLQANVNYLSERITAQGEDSRFLIPNFSIKKSFLSNRLTIMAQWQNMSLGLLPTNEQRISTRGADFFTTTNYILEKDIFLINLSYSLRQLSKRAKLPGNEFGDKEF
ncbi:outer membrane beta-barrel family protein [Arundinibacter roseus]|uniref:TonB-dependent receptor n=1 Tax=Arundinibacter roseus TaxID=2070510 RepID=A0A4R4K4J3_9BACT|nr:outer membrane beta-barrel family protein [Arundinibacter roseus]TDB62347.1 TonB-dependent receptor [Arundinibacter roseus]